MKQIETKDVSQTSQDSAIENSAGKPQFYTSDCLTRLSGLGESRAMQRFSKTPRIDIPVPTPRVCPEALPIKASDYTSNYKHHSVNFPQRSLALL
jgi:hypothetical protein